jgi:hypothetical protein
MLVAGGLNPTLGAGARGAGALVAFRLRQLSEDPSTFPANRQGQQRVESGRNSTPLQYGPHLTFPFISIPNQFFGCVSHAIIRGG